MLSEDRKENGKITQQRNVKSMSAIQIQGPSLRKLTHFCPATMTQFQGSTGGMRVLPVISATKEHKALCDSMNCQFTGWKVNK